MPRGDKIVDCPTCDGKGYTLTRVNVTDMWRRDCPSCDGTGKAKPGFTSKRLTSGELARIYEKLERC